MRLVSFFQKHSVIVETQYGFQNNKSTSHAILDVLTNAYDNIESNDNTAIVLLDFKKAFDTVCHSILLNKLEHYGIRGIALKLLKLFLIVHNSLLTKIYALKTQLIDLVFRKGVTLALYYSLSTSTTFLTHCSLNPGYLSMTRTW